MDDMDKQVELPDDDKVVFVPTEDIRAIESIYDKMERAQREFRIIAKKMKQAEE
jgi:hypothetical protein